MKNDWSIQQIARLAGTTSRTLRHYDDIGLLRPSRLAANGYRHYDAAALVRLQRILLLRDLGLGLPQIAEVLARPASEVTALERHLAWLHDEQSRLARRIASVASTITALREGADMSAETMFDGFDHTQHREEVERRWGADAYARGDAWWRGLADDERRDFRNEVAALNAAWTDAAGRGIPAHSDEARDLAIRHIAWLSSVPGTPAADVASADAEAYVLGLAEVYVADPRFAANYGGQAGAEFVRAALRAHLGAD